MPPNSPQTDTDQTPNAQPGGKSPFEFDPSPFEPMAGLLSKIFTLGAPAAREVTEAAARKAARDKDGLVIDKTVRGPAAAVDDPIEAATDAAGTIRARVDAEVPPPKDTAPPPAEGGQGPQIAPDPGNQQAPGPPPPLVGEPPVTDVAADAARLRSREMGEFDLKDSAQPNFDFIDTTDDVRTVIADVGERFKGKIDKARRGKIAHSELQKMAENLGTTSEFLTPLMQKLHGGKVPINEIPETLLAANHMMASSAERISMLAKKIVNGQASKEEELQYIRQRQMHNELQAGFMGLRAEVGRALGVLRIPVGGSQVGRLHELASTTSPEDILRLAKMDSVAESVAEITQLAKPTTLSKFKAVGMENFMASILSGVKTHVVNGSGNVLFLGMNVAETVAAEGFARSRIALARVGMRAAENVTAEDLARRGESMALIWGMIQSTKSAFRASGKAFRTGEVVDDTLRADLPHRRAISAEFLDLNGTTGRVVDFIGATIRFPLERVMAPMDEFIKEFSAGAELYRGSFVRAQQRQLAEGLDDSQTADYLRTLLQNPDADLAAQANDFARYATFQKELGEIGSAVQRTVGKSFLLRQVTPFIRTPVNLFKTAFAERTPLGVFTRSFQDNVRAGGRRRDLALARVAMGSALSGQVAMWHAEGRITGGGPSDFKKANNLKSLGWQPYSYVTYDAEGNATFTSYQRTEPLSYIVGSIANAADMFAWHKNRSAAMPIDEQQDKLVGSIIAAISENMMSKTFMSGATDLIESMERGNMSGWVGRQAAAHIPFSSFRRDLTKIADPMIKLAWQTGDRIRRDSGLQIAGWSDGAPDLLDPFGNPVRHPSGNWLGLMSPWPTKRVDYNATRIELARVFESTLRSPVRMPPRHISFRDAGSIRLTEQQYHDYVLHSRKEVLLGGMNYEEQLTEVVNSPAYSEAFSDEDRLAILEKVRGQYDKAGAAIMRRDNQDLKERSLLVRKQQLEGQFGTEAADDLLQEQRLEIEEQIGAEAAARILDAL